MVYSGTNHIAIYIVQNQQWEKISKFLSRNQGCGPKPLGHCILHVLLGGDGGEQCHLAAPQGSSENDHSYYRATFEYTPFN